MAHETLKINRHSLYDETEAEIVVHFKYRAGRPAWGGSRYEPPINPPEPDEIDILKIESYGVGFGIARVTPVDITDLISEHEYEYIENYLYENWQADGGDDKADRRYDEGRE